jgi:hypothetical protein
MKTFPYVEDYLEVLNGYRDPVTGKLLGLFNNTPPIVALARYDVKVLDSMSQSTQCHNALTDRQAELACKIILKYRKQLASKLIDVSPIEYPKFRMPLREIDRTCSLNLEDGNLILKFPYDVKLIESMRELSKMSNGRWSFDRDRKVWRIGLTEPNVIAAHGFATINQFVIGTSVNDLVKKIIEAEQIDYKIQLTDCNGSYEIKNAPPSLLQYLNNNVDLNNIIELVDYAPILYYDVDSTIEEYVTTQYSGRIFNLLSTSEIKFAPTSLDTQLFDDIVKYCDITNRYPIYVYEPDMSDKLYNNFVQKYFSDKEVVKLTNTKNLDITDTTKVVFFNKYNAHWNNDIPLLISSVGMMHGGEKTMLLQRAKKVVYFAAEVYNVKTINRH